MADGLRMSLSSAGIVAGLENLNRELQDKALRKASYEVCTVLYDELRLTVPKATGNMEKAIYRYRHENSGAANEFWTVGVNLVKAPHFHLVEHGHWQPYKVIFSGGRFITTKEKLSSPKWTPPNAFFRASYDSKINVALQAGLDSLKAQLKEFV